MAVVKNQGAGNKTGRWQYRANKTRWFLSPGIMELWNSFPWDIAGHRVQEAIRHTESKDAACGSINLWFQNDLWVGEQPEETIPTWLLCVYPTPQLLQEAEFLTRVHFCSSSFSLMLQLSNTWPTPPPKRWLCNIYCGLPVHWWKNGNSGKIRR